MSSHPLKSFRGWLAPALVALAAFALAAPALAVDDRDLFSSGSETPYLFVLFDTSGSMHWKAPCNDPDGCAYECPMSDALCAKICPRHICIDDVTGVVTQKPVCSIGETESWLCETGSCPQGDCFAPLSGDDPGSKLFQAKSALYQVVDETLQERIPLSLGFATFNQDDLRMRGSHWLYNLDVTGGQITLDSGRKFPNANIPQVFGRTWNCRIGPDIGFEWQEPATLGQAWQETRMFRCPQMGQDGNSNSTDVFNMLYFIDPADNELYRAEYQQVSGEDPGDASYRIHMHVERCDTADCTSRTRIGDRNIRYDLISEFASWDAGARANNDLTARRVGFFSQSAAADSFGNAASTCFGWDPNDDSGADANNGVNIRFLTEPTDPLGAELTVGDIIPLDWRFDHKEEVLRRLAPNRSPGNGTADNPPDFRVAPFFQDTAPGNLNLLSTNERVITGYGATPIAASVKDFAGWFNSWKSKATATGTGDRTFGCKNVYLLIITDGDNTCTNAGGFCPNTDPTCGTPCDETAAIYGAVAADPQVQTYVIGFGLAGGAGNSLLCMPNYLVGDAPFDDPDGKCKDEMGNSLFNSQGICKKPFFASNQQELVEAIKSVVSQVTGTSRAFATAAVPSVQANVNDKLFLSNFVPTPTAYWDGHINAFLKPLPLNPDGTPDLTDPNFLWDAGKEVADNQVPAGDKLGGSASQRRVYYSLFPQNANVPQVRRFFEKTDSTLPIQTRRDLWYGMEIAFLAGNTASQNAAEDEANLVVDELLALKQYNNPDLGLVDYVIGDVFHSDPVLVGTPPNTLYFTLNLEDNGLPCDDASNGKPVNPSYRCFALKHENRRKLLFAGTNGGMLHAFDAGIYDPLTDEFDDGTGREMFAYIPRAVLPTIKDMSQNDDHDFAVDGTFKIDDVFIDPSHLGSPVDSEREWRSVGIGGLRRGGVGYYALDITQPDPVNKTTDADGNPLWVPQPRSDRLPACWGGEAGTSLTSNCGEAPFPAPLWEFTDTVSITSFIDVSLDEEPSTTTFVTVNGRSEEVVGKSEFDSGGNLLAPYPDLGESWSEPVIGRIAICGAPGTNCDPSASGGRREALFVWRSIKSCDSASTRSL